MLQLLFVESAIFFAFTLSLKYINITPLMDLLSGSSSSQNVLG